MAAVVLESIGVVVGKVLSDLNVNQKLKKKVKRIPKIKMFQKRGPERNSSKILINVQNNRNAVILINLLQNNGLISSLFWSKNTLKSEALLPNGYQEMDYYSTLSSNSVLIKRFENWEKKMKTKFQLNVILMTSNKTNVYINYIKNQSNDQIL